jgi:glutamine synthetase
LAKELFGKAFIEGYVASMSMELPRFFDEITPWERRVLAAQA